MIQSKISESIFITICNQVKRNIQLQNNAIDNIIDLVVFIMQEVEMCEYVSSSEKEDLVIRITFSLDYDYIQLYDAIFVSKTINAIIDASKGKLNLNRKRSLWKQFMCGVI